MTTTIQTAPRTRKKAIKSSTVKARKPGKRPSRRQKATRPVQVRLNAQTISTEEIDLLLEYADKVERKGDVLECTFTEIEEAEGSSVKVEALQGLIVAHDIRNCQVGDAVATTEAA